MHITVSDDLEMRTIVWPSSEVADLLPKPKSDYGNISSSSDTCLIIYIGNMTMDDYADGVLSSGALLSGLMVNAGIGLAILFRNNRPVKDSFRVVGILFGISVVCGILIDLTTLGAWIAK